MWHDSQPNQYSQEVLKQGYLMVTGNKDPFCILRDQLLYVKFTTV